MFHSTPIVDHPHCMHDHPNTACQKKTLEEQRCHLLAEAKCEILKQECKVDTLNTCTREIQRPAHSNRLEMDYVNHGYEESRLAQESRPGFMKNWLNEKKNFEKRLLEVFIKWMN